MDYFRRAVVANELEGCVLDVLVAERHLVALMEVKPEADDEIWHACQKLTVAKARYQMAQACRRYIELHPVRPWIYVPDSFYRQISRQVDREVLDGLSKYMPESV